MVNQPGSEPDPKKSPNSQPTAEPAAADENSDEHTPYTLRSMQRANFVYPRAPSPRSVVQVGELETVAQRTPLRYEMLEDVLDELPDFARETISNAWEGKLKTN